MKKAASIIGILALASAAYSQDGNFPLNSITNPSLSNLKVSAAVGFESEYVFRAEKLAGLSIQPKVELGYNIAGFDAYAGAWMNSPLEKQRNSAGDLVNLEEVDLYAGMSYSYGSFTVDLGYTYYWYPSDNDGATRDSEVYAGIMMDTASYLGLNLNPSVYYFYNFQLEQHTIEASLGYELQLGSYVGLPKLTLPLRAYFGYLTADRRNGDQDYGSPDLKGSYMYYGGSADIAYAITDYCTISAGVRYSQRFEESGDAGAISDRGERKFWYGAKVDFGF